VEGVRLGDACNQRFIHVVRKEERRGAGGIVVIGKDKRNEQDDIILVSLQRSLSVVKSSSPHAITLILPISS